MLSYSDNSKMNIQFCIDNNNSSNTIENTNNKGIRNDSAEILTGDETDKTKKVTDIDEFEQVFNEYKKQQINSVEDNETTNLKTTNESIDTETIVDMSMDLVETASNVNISKTTQVDVNSIQFCNNNWIKPDMNEIVEINKSQDCINSENLVQFIKTEIDTVAMISNEGLIDENDQNLDLNALTNIFDSNNKNIEIEIDIQNEITDESINNAFVDVTPSEEHSNFDINHITLCDNSSINITIDLTDSPNIIDLTDSPRLELETTDSTNDMSNKESISDFGNWATESKDINFCDNESDCSFHSSDFELITEEEAKLDGLILNFRQQNEISGDNSLNNDNIIDMYLAGPSNDYAYRENHRIPEGDEFYSMFHGIYAPANIPDLIFMENKSVVPSQCMDVENDGFGLDLAALNKEVDKEYLDEAKETSKKILNTYHDFNERKRRRRHL